MDIADSFFFGFFVREHGLNGNLLVSVKASNAKAYLNLNKVWVHVFNTLVETPITNFQLLSEREALIKLAAINTNVEAKAYIGKEIYLPLTILPKLEQDEFYYFEIIGYKVIDQSHGDIGIVKDVYEMPAQDVLAITKDEKEILVPITDAFVLKVNREQRELYTNLPEGLLEVFEST